MSDLTKEELELLKRCQEGFQKVGLVLEKIAPTKFAEELMEYGKKLELKLEDGVVSQAQYDEQQKALNNLWKNKEEIEKLLQDKRQEVINWNQQAMQQEADMQQDQQLLVQNSVGQSVILTLPAAQSDQQQSPNVAMRLPKLTMNTGAVSKAVKDISEEVARKIADQQKPPLIRQEDSQNRQVRYVTAPGQNLNAQQQSLQAKYNEQLMDALKKNNLTATLTRQALDTKQMQTAQAQQQQAQQKFGINPRSPFATKPVPPGVVH